MPGNCINPNIVRAHLPVITDARTRQIAKQLALAHYRLAGNKWTIRYCVRYAWVFCEACARIVNGKDGSIRVRAMCAESLRRQCGRYVAAV